LAVSSTEIKLSGANPTIVSMVQRQRKKKITTSSLGRFENKNIFFTLSNALAYYDADAEIVNS
jgi:homoserine kinase